MKNSLKSTILILIVCLLFIFMDTGCSRSDQAASSADQTSEQKIKLTIETGAEGPSIFPSTFYQPNIEAFEQKYPNIEVELLLIPESQVKMVLQTKLASGQPSDIIIYNKISGENELAAAKKFIDLSHESWVDRLENPDILKASDGKIYGFALQDSTSCLGMVYNMEILDRLNLSVPRNYNELMKVCKVIKESGITPIYAPFRDIWTFQICTTSSWGYIAEKKKPGIWEQINTGKVKWSDIPEFEDTLQKALELYKRGYMQETLLFDNYDSAPDAFINNKCAMMFGSSEFVSSMQKMAPDLKLDIYPVPVFNENNPYIAKAQLGALLFIPKKSEHIKEAKLFIDFISQKEQIDRAQAAGAFIPMTKDAAAPRITPFQQEIVDKYIKSGQSVTEMNAYMKVDLNDLWKYYQEMFGGTKTPEQVLKAWDIRFAELMKDKGNPGF